MSLPKDKIKIKINSYFYVIMKNKIWYVIGLMSGTSLDGVDLVYTKIIRNKNTRRKFNFAVKPNFAMFNTS